MNKNPQKRYREIREDCRTVAVIRFFIFLPKERMCYMPENRPTPTYPNIGDFNRYIDWFPKSRIDPNETRIRELEREVAELRRYKEEQEEKENPRVKKYRKKVVIQTLEGEMVISKGDYIIKGIKGEYYPCKPDIFEESYERV